MFSAALTCQVVQEMDHLPDLVGHYLLYTPILRWVQHTLCKLQYYGMVTIFILFQKKSCDKAMRYKIPVQQIISMAIPQPFCLFLISTTSLKGLNITMPSQHHDEATIESDPLGVLHSSQTCCSCCRPIFLNAHQYRTFVWMLVCAHHKNHCPLL